MNDTIHNILAFISIGLAVYFLCLYIFKKFKNKGCSSGCGCNVKEKFKN
ncbi:MAG: hypothetical protein ACQPRJ_01115 [Solitalea-like symbiont of Acarus siro]